MKKRNNKIKYIVIFIIILFALLIALTSKSLEEKRNLNFFEKAIKDTATFTQKIFYTPIDFVKDKIKMLEETKDLYKKYTDL